jgi:hypothetical protein
VKTLEGCYRASWRLGLLNPFIDPDDNTNLEFTRCLRQLSDFQSMDRDAVRSQLRKHLFRGLVILKRGTWTDVEPNGISGNPCLSKGNQPDSLLGGTPDQFESLSEAPGLVVVDRRRLGNRNRDNRS